MHPAAPHHLPFFISGPDGSDGLMLFMGLFLVGTLLWVGTLYWKLHSLPERMAHRTHKLQLEIVAVPEPTTVALELSIGILGLIGFRRRRSSFRST